MFFQLISNLNTWDLCIWLNSSPKFILFKQVFITRKEARICPGSCGKFSNPQWGSKFHQFLFKRHSILFSCRCNLMNSLLKFVSVVDQRLQWLSHWEQSVHQLHWMADTSRKGINASAGLMVNYLYRWSWSLSKFVNVTKTWNLVISKILN